MFTALLVDDSPIIRRLVCGALTRAGFVVDLAASGLEGMRILANHTPDVIITDLQMPGMNGREFISKVRENACIAEIPIILISGSTCHVDEIMPEGIFGLVLKDADITRNLYRLLSALHLKPPTNSTNTIVPPSSDGVPAYF